jgi:hypothetical protein
MAKAKRARTAETPKQPSLRLTLRAPYLYPDRAYSADSDVPRCPHNVRYRGQLGPDILTLSSSPYGTNLPTRHVRSSVAIGGKADLSRKDRNRRE